MYQIDKHADVIARAMLGLWLCGQGKGCVMGRLTAVVPVIALASLVATVLIGVSIRHSPTTTRPTSLF